MLKTLWYHERPQRAQLWVCLSEEMPNVMTGMHFWFSLAKLWAWCLIPGMLVPIYYYFDSSS